MNTTTPQLFNMNKTQIACALKIEEITCTHNEPTADCLKEVEAACNHFYLNTKEKKGIVKHFEQESEYLKEYFNHQWITEMVKNAFKLAWPVPNQ